MRKIMLCIVAIAVSGCASTENKSAAISAEQEQNGYKCEKVKVTGSNFPRKVCTTESQRVEMARKSQEMLRRATSGGTGSGNGGS